MRTPQMSSPRPRPNAWRHYLESRRRFRPYLLTEGEERVAAEKALSGSLAWERLFSELLSSIRVPLDGEEVSLDEARERLRTLTDKRDREMVAEAITQALEPNIRLRALVLNTVASDRAIDDGLRGYPSWISERNLQNEIGDAAAQALIDAVVSRYDVVHRHFRLRAGLLGLPKLADYDRFAPVEEDVASVDWDDARALAVEAFAAFSPEAGEIVERFFDERWIDAAPRAGKVPGRVLRDAGRSSASVHPHELQRLARQRADAGTRARPRRPRGARRRSRLSQPRVPADVRRGGVRLRRDARLPGAPRTRDDGPRTAGAARVAHRRCGRHRLRHGDLEQARGRGAHTPARARRALRRADQRAVGDRRTCDERRRGRDHAGFRTWWSYVPHFVAVPGYMYAYAFGYLLSLSIYERYREQGDALVEPILDMLRAGSSDSPDRLAARLGLDLADPQFWHRGLDAIEQLVAEAEALASASTQT
jgi:oligoendopeptidase F